MSKTVTVRMNAHETRIELARLGWNTEDRLSEFGWGTDGKRGYSAWVNRWEWHGVRLGGRVSFQAAVPPESLSPENIDRAWQKLHETALAAWRDFPESIPCQDCFGKTVEDKLLTGIICNVHRGNPWITANRPIPEPVEVEWRVE